MSEAATFNAYIRARQALMDTVLEPDAEPKEKLIEEPMPCPFCGAEVRSRGYKSIKCIRCECWGPDPEQGSSREEAIRIWNKRVDAPECHCQRDSKNE